MKTYNKKANESYKIRRVKKGTLDKLHLNITKQDNRAEQIWNRWKDKYEHKKEEIERLNNIINEFDKWLLGEQMMFYRGSDDERLIRFGEIKYKWLKLKGDSSNE